MKTISGFFDQKEYLVATEGFGAYLPYFETIWNWNLNPPIQRALNDGFLPPQVAEASAEEYRRFLFLIAVSKRAYGMTSKTVDAVWHAHILHTRDYTSFCNKVFGAYLHHEPDDGETGSTTANLEEINEFYQHYQKFFGPVSYLWSSHVKICQPSKLCTPTLPAAECAKVHFEIAR